MEETTVIASLPNLEIRVVRRELPEEGAEMVGIQIKATPSFDAVADGVRRSLMAPSPWPLSPWLAPLQFWTTAAERMWRPWLALAGPLAAARMDRQAD